MRRSTRGTLAALLGLVVLAVSVTGCERWEDGGLEGAVVVEH